MTEKIYGTIELPGTVDITDPCYDENVWCRINDFPISAGSYECYILEAGNNETEGWGKRIARCGIRKDKATHYERRGMIGVDSGMAGFFNCENRKIFEDIMESDMGGGTIDVAIGKNYFVTSSGYGDGGYDVYTGYKDGEQVEVYIEFIGE